jgi:hypothetical protein
LLNTVVAFLKKAFADGIAGLGQRRGDRTGAGNEEAK